MPITRSIILIASILLITSVSYTDDLSEQTAQNFEEKRWWGPGFIIADDLSEPIAQHRMGTLTVQAAPGVPIKIEQLRHEFWFGAALPDRVFRPGEESPDAQKFKEVFLENFNSAVTENAVKWYSMERRKGEVNYSIVDAMLEWTDANEIPLRGHNLFWGVSQFIQPWIKELGDDELSETIRNRAITMGKRYRGRFVEYDLNNEMIHENYYEKRLGPDITKNMADWFRQEDPDTPLFVNDYDILTGRRLNAYVEHIRGLLDAGVPIGGIGVQGHFHAETFDADALKKSLDVLAQFDLPIRITEFNMPGQESTFYKNRQAKLTEEQEKQKAAELVKYFRICFAHPAVDGILLWGFWEGANWIPASSLFFRDWTPTPAGLAYRDLVFNEWWTNYEGKTDPDGRCEIKAFFGKYRVLINGKETLVDLKKEDGVKTVSIVE